MTERRPPRSIPVWLAGVIAVLSWLFGAGPVWQYDQHKLEEVRVENDIYERLRSLQAEFSAELPSYIKARDKYMLTADKYGKNSSVSQYDEVYTLQNDYNIIKDRLYSVIRQYDRLEAKLAKLEGREPQWLVIPVSIPPITDVQAYNVGGGRVKLTMRLPDPDPLLIESRKNIQSLGYRPPSLAIPESVEIHSEDSTGKERTTFVVPSRYPASGKWR